MIRTMKKKFNNSSLLTRNFTSATYYKSDETHLIHKYFLQYSSQGLAAPLRYDYALFKNAILPQETAKDDYFFSA